MRRRTALLTLLLLVGIVAVPVVLTWQQVTQEQLNHALIAAVDRNDVSAVRRLLRQGASPNAQVMPEDERPVWKRIWERLWHRIPTQLPAHESVLMKAVNCDVNQGPDRCVDNADIVEALVAAGATVNFVEHIPKKDSEESTSTPLVSAAAWSKWKSMSVLLSHNADVNTADDYHVTALHYTAGNANFEMVGALLKQGARIDALDDDQRSALVYAISSNGPAAKVRKTVALLLQHGAAVKSTTELWPDLLLFAREEHLDPQVIQMLKRAGGK